MNRRPEPELMTCPDQAIAYAQADFSSSDRSMIERLINWLDELQVNLVPGSTILDLGCGPGNIAQRLAVQWPHSDVIGIDGSISMLRIANQRLNNEESSSSNLQYKHVDLNHCRDLNLGFASRASLLVSNSLLHHLHDPQRLWSVVQALASPGALTLHRDLRRPSDESAVNSLCERYVSDAPTVLKRDFRASLHAAFTVDEVRSQLQHAGMPHLAVREVGDRYLEVYGQWFP